jgi:hypothetical protein
MVRHFETMTEAIDEASVALDRRNDAMANREAFRAFLTGLFAGIEGLAYQLGADGSYLSDEFLDITGKNGQVDSAFLDLVESMDESARGARHAHRRALNSITYDRARA